MDGPVELSYEAWTSLARASSQPIGAWSCGLSQLPIAYLHMITRVLGIFYLLGHKNVNYVVNGAYHKHASQCAISTNVAIRRSRTAVPYSEYLSILRATRTSRSRRAVFRRPMSVVVCNHHKDRSDSAANTSSNVI